MRNLLNRIAVTRVLLVALAVGTSTITLATPALAAARPAVATMIPLQFCGPDKDGMEVTTQGPPPNYWICLQNGNGEWVWVPR
jgi:hypothetical protein